MPVTLTPEKQEEMLSTARVAFKNAHAPYSNFRVGSAILTDRGTLYHGCNVENASYGLTICAERNAIFAAVAAEGSGMRIKATRPIRTVIIPSRTKIVRQDPAGKGPKPCILRMPDAKCPPTAPDKGAMEI